MVLPSLKTAKAKFGFKMIAWLSAELRNSLQALKEKLQQVESPQFHSVALRLSLKDETEIASALSIISKQHSSVSVGSYPVGHS